MIPLKGQVDNGFGFEKSLEVQLLFNPTCEYSSKSTADLR